MVRAINWLKIVLLAAMLAAASVSIHAADRLETTPLPETVDRVSAGKLYLKRRAALLLLRARFADIAADEIPGRLAADAKTIAGAGPSSEAIAELDSNLLAEGSYYIVSLVYLVQSGGALWPTDKAEKTYVYDALTKLDDLQAELFAAVKERTDPLPVLVEIDRINAWTEGYSDLPASLDHFEGRDALVAAALATAQPVGT